MVIGTDKEWKMTKLSVEMLLEASRPGGAGALSSVTRLAPAGGNIPL